MRKWAEQNNLLSDFQFGFRRGRSTIDCIFVLNSIINKVIKHDKKKLYCAFIDFKKAFDLVYRNGIWYKLILHGCSSKMVNMLKGIYNRVKSCVRINGNVTEFFESYMGVKQGENLSPLLFICFINDLYDNIKNNTFDTFSIDDLQIFLLLFADDTVLFSYSKEGLQNLVNQMYKYCNDWGIAVNTNKTVVMVCTNGNRKANIDILYNNIKLEVVNKFTYLGVTLSSNGCFYQAQKSLSQQALRAVYSLYGLFDIVSLNITEKLKLFDVMISPILNYGAEIWGFHKSPDIERVHIKFMKQILCVRQQTTGSAVYGELGRFPMYIQRKIQIMKYWHKIVKNPYSMQYKLFKMSDVQGNNINDWTLNVKKLLDSTGFSYLWTTQHVTNVDLKCVIQRICDQYIQSWFDDISKSSKLETYYFIKNSFEQEIYISSVNNNNHRIALTRLRCSAHKLMIEEGRIRNIEREARLCTLCNMQVIENEYHFVLVCPFYRKLRHEILPKYYNSWPNKDKFKALLQTSNKGLLWKLAKFVYCSNVLRKSMTG